jgi:hypothetical protein
MHNEQFAAKIAYACIFAKTVEDATENLIRLIADRARGLDEGPGAWRDVLKVYLEAPEDLGQLNRFGASFSVPEWRAILEQVGSSLRACSELDEGELEPPLGSR